MHNNLKFSYFIGFFAICSLLVSCNKDDDEVPVSPIVGPGIIAILTLVALSIIKVSHLF
ncbi:hypothetical protein BH23BAC1_BH23BAC1_07100 [soil metagenome]